ncbi:unnamed protein product [Moneuplotes crassus]|uniref:Uncharacterized protein n=1 Tax=Euplotes crassus TaxID=5936 RepID=A0AAD1XNC8_EUPCR|nr:unnamed protein product [Moneuplotes crassus]
MTNCVSSRISSYLKILISCFIGEEEIIFIDLEIPSICCLFIFENALEILLNRKTFH